MMNEIQQNVTLRLRYMFLNEEKFGETFHLEKIEIWYKVIISEMKSE